jgi:hypothetical protein
VTMSIECWPINGSYHSVAIILPSRLLINDLSECCDLYLVAYKQKKQKDQERSDKQTNKNLINDNPGKNPRQLIVNLYN